MSMRAIRRFLDATAFSERFGRQMRLIAGPRQCGKTTLAKGALARFRSNLYYNWDEKKIRRRYRAEEDFLESDLLQSKPRSISWVCFDEIHKMPRWKDILKGLFDAHENRVRFIVTGSARLDLFRSSGDSLSGRYLLFRLHPLILAEVLGADPDHILPEKDATAYVEKAAAAKGFAQKTMEELLAHSGFPEPLTKGDAVFHKKWGESYLEYVVRQDVRDLSRILHIEKVLDLVYALSSRVGSPLSVNSLREDIEVNFATAKNYIKYLLMVYAVFDLPPFTKRGSRLVKKERKIYFYDWTRVADQAARFENYVALELKVRTEMWSDRTEDDFSLFHLRTRDGAETDFLITQNGSPWLLLEAKTSAVPIAPHHLRHAELAGEVPFVQIVREPGILRAGKGGRLTVSASRFFS
ncbi:MAG: ATP-binding protein [Elusimicrobia bacterium]|nr:ATP-binding protein [Elusimicrobiota bacterium]